MAKSDSTESVSMPRYPSLVLEEDELSANHSDHASVVTNGKTTQNDGEVIGQQEDKAIFWLRLLTIFVLVGAAIGTSVGVYFVTRGHEEETFQTKFDAMAEKVLET